MSLKKLFCFTRSERRGIFCLVVILLVLLGLNIISDTINRRKEQELSKNITPQYVKGLLCEGDSCQIKPKQHTGSSFKATTAERKNHGQNRSPETKAKNIEAAATSKSKNVLPASYKKSENKKPAAILYIELNSADTTELKKLRGIGSVLSRRIVKYRDKMGGFYTNLQLAEVYGLSPETLESILPQVWADSSKVKPMHINSLSIAELKAHPYISYYMACAIKDIQGKSASGIVESYSQLLAHPDFENANPYLEKYLNFD